MEAFLLPSSITIIFINFLNCLTYCTMEMNYKIISNANIDKPWWDNQLRLCKNSLVYAQSWYLDAVCPGWKAIVIGDNEAFIPLTSNIKWGIFPTWIQPAFAQQLGIFYKQKHLSVYTDVLAQISKKFIKVNIHLNHLNGPNACQKPNYLLDLSPEYRLLKKAYNKDAKKNLRPINDFKFTKTALTHKSFTELKECYAAQYGSKAGVKTQTYKTLAQLLKAAEQQNCLQLYNAMDAAQNLLFSAALLVFENRIYYLFGAPSASGRRLNIAHYFIDHIIQTYSGSQYLLDFEGSAIPSVAQFYKKWGTKNYPYPIFRSGLLG